MIRALTIGLPLGDLSTREIEAQVKRLVDAAQEELGKGDLVSRMFRFTLPPVGLEGEQEGVLLSRLRWVDQLAVSVGTRWFCQPLDFVEPGRRQGRLSAALDGVIRFERLFLNLILAKEQQIAVKAAYDAARLILQLSRKSNNGFDNFRVGASFNCPANAPFFPFSRHEGTGVAFSFALETTQLATEVLDDLNQPLDLNEARDELIERLTPALRSLDEVGERLASKSGVEYRGLDASFAPLPVDDVAVGSLVEKIVGAPVGSHGTTFATALLTDVLRSALAASNARAVGFNGVMYSILEDPILAAANSKRLVTVDTLLSLAAVCACGLDMVPIPGLSFPEEIGTIMLDTAALSSALNKPLGVRLLPIPNGHVNDFTSLSLDFLCDSRILGLSSNVRPMESGQHLFGFRKPLVESGS